MTIQSEVPTIIDFPKNYHSPRHNRRKSTVGTNSAMSETIDSTPRRHRKDQGNLLENDIKVQDPDYNRHSKKLQTHRVKKYGYTRSELIQHSLKPNSSTPGRQRMREKHNLKKMRSRLGSQPTPNFGKIMGQRSNVKPSLTVITNSAMSETSTIRTARLPEQ